MNSHFYIPSLIYIYSSTQLCWFPSTIHTLVHVFSIPPTLLTSLATCSQLLSTTPQWMVMERSLKAS